MAKRQAGKTTNGESFVFVDSEELPESYHQTQLTLIVRDPYWLHAYWEITPDAIQNVAQEIGYEARQCAYVLRMYDVTLKDFDGTNANHWFDIEVGSEANSWYVNLWNDKVAYCGDIGLRAPDGRFFTLARSNAVQTQRANFSPRSEVIWMEVAGEEVNPPYVMAKGLLANVLENRQIQGPREKENISPYRNKLPLSAEEIRAYYAKCSPLLKRILGGHFEEELQEEEWHEEELYEEAWGGEGFSEALFGDFVKGEYWKKILLGASEELTVKEGQAEQLPLSSHVQASEQKEQQHKFFFEIGTEVIVYGRTEPDAKVYLGEKEIKLREDGTFTLRYSLPTDTKIPLNFVAKSSNGIDQREIVTEVGRAPTYFHPRCPDNRDVTPKFVKT